MADRRRLHEMLCSVPGVKKVYFQPPESVKMEYDCIRYKSAPPSIRRADNTIYKSCNRYELIHITLDPDSQAPEYIMRMFPMCSIDRMYVSDNLYHTVFTLYF